MTPEEHLAHALSALGFTDDPELAETPAKFAELLRDYAPGVQLPEITPLTSESEDLVVLRDLPFHSLCVHHLVPFFGSCTIAYRPDGRIGGLGSFPRLLATLSRRPQLQERLAQQLVTAIDETLAPHAVGVRLSARQMCMEMRGARSQGTCVVSATRGETDQELLLALHGVEGFNSVRTD